MGYLSTNRFYGPVALKAFFAFNAWSQHKLHCRFSGSHRKNCNAGDICPWADIDTALCRAAVSSRCQPKVSELAFDELYFSGSHWAWLSRPAGGHRQKTLTNSYSRVAALLNRSLEKDGRWVNSKRVYINNLPNAVTVMEKWQHGWKIIITCISIRDRTWNPHMNIVMLC